MKKGWIKEYRRGIDDLSELTDPQYRYYKTSCLLAVWDKRNADFGTFDARTKTMRTALPHWSAGKINMVKNSLLTKNYYIRAENFRLGIANAEYLLGKNNKIEYYIQNTETNIHTNENEIQQVENILNEIEDARNNLAIDKTMPWNQDSAG